MSEMGPIQPQGSDQDTLRTHLMIGLTASMQLMAEKVGEFAQSMNVLSKRVEQVDYERKRDRSFLILGILIVVVSVVGVGLVVRDNRKTLHILERVTGPEAQAANAANTARIVDEIDCNGEENLRKVLEELARTIPQIKVPEEAELCRELREQQETATTTTSG